MLYVSGHALLAIASSAFPATQYTIYDQVIEKEQVIDLWPLLG
jgi:hypothetical protein